MNKNFIIDYMNTMVEKIKIIRPELDEEQVKSIVKKTIKERFKDVPCTFEGKETTGRNMIKFINTEQCIIDPYGTLFQRHENAPNQLADMVDMLLKERKVAKKNKFKHENDEDKTLYRNFDMIQLTLKLLANSFYGASIEANSIFYHPYFGSSVTGAGQSIIMTAINIFEKFIGNHVIFRNVNDVLIYCTNIMTEERNEYIEDILDKTSDEVYEYLLSKLEGDNNGTNLLYSFLHDLDREDLNRIYYKNNLLEFIASSQHIQDILINITAKEDFLDPNSPPEHYKEFTEPLWNIIREWIYYDKMDFYRRDNCENKTRVSVLTIDTDSTFCYVQPYVEKCYEVFGIEDTPLNRMTITNVIGWMIGKVIAENYALMTKNFGIPESKRPIINMKNE